MQFVNEQNNVLRAPDFIHDRLDALFKLAAIFRAGDHERQVERDDALVAQQVGHVALGDFLRQPFDDGRLAHAGFAEQHRIVLRAAAKNLNDTLDFVLAADDRVHVALARNFRKIASKRLEGGRLDFAFLFCGPFLANFRDGRFLAGEIRVQFLQNFLPRLLDVHVQVPQNPGGHAVAFAQQA